MYLQIIKFTTLLPLEFPFTSFKHMQQNKYLDFCSLIMFFFFFVFFGSLIIKLENKIKYKKKKKAFKTFSFIDCRS